jgi:XisI protein
MDSSPAALANSNPVPVEVCQQAIIDALLESIPESLIPKALQVVPVFDRQSHRYQLLRLGWLAVEKRIFYPIIHIEIIEGEVWIQHNQSDRDIGEALCDRGIPKSQIVLGLYPPSLRQLNPTYAGES